MPSPPDRTVRPLLLALLAVAIFSGTAIGTRAAAQALGGWQTGLLRLAIGGAAAAALLALARAPWPDRATWIRLLPVIAGCGIGFPLLLALAMDTVDATHAAVATGLIPAGTAAVGAWWAGERPPARVWLGAAIGAAAVAAAAGAGARGGPAAGDALLGAAVAAAAVGYVAGARLAGAMPGWQVICWAVAAPLPAVAILAAIAAPDLPARLAAAPAAAWVGLAWIGLGSQVIGFFPWYRALAAGGIARVSQVQLLQPGLGVLWAWLLLREEPGWPMLAALAAVGGGLMLCLPRRAGTGQRG